MVESQPSPTASGEAATFLHQRHPHLFNYFCPVSFNKALPLGSLFYTKWLSIHLHLLHKGNRKLTVALDETVQILEAYLSGDRTYMLPLWGCYQQPQTLFLLMLPSVMGSFGCTQSQDLKWCMAFHLHRALADSFQLGFSLEGSCYWVCMCHAT